MPSYKYVVDFLNRKIKEAVAPFTHFSVGSVEDETLCLICEDDEWVVGYGERGKFWPRARFRSAVAAADHLIFLLLSRPNESFTFPAIDWTGYAALPDD